MSQRHSDSYRPPPSWSPRDDRRSTQANRPPMFRFGEDQSPRRTSNYPERHDDGYGDSRNRSPRYRPSVDDSSNPNSFTFRQDPPPSVTRRIQQSSDTNGRRQNGDHYEPSNSMRRGRYQREDGRRPRNNRSPRPRAGGRFRRANLAHERPLLATTRDKTPDQLDGMVNNTEGTSKYLDVDDVSDSAEEDMDVESSENENVSSVSSPDANIKKSAAEDQKVSEQDVTKNESSEPMTNGAKPKWSNPDPYTSLPPPDESKVKKRDVVRLIRKARIVDAKGKTSENAAAANKDFISLDFGELSESADSHITISDDPDTNRDASTKNRSRLNSSKLIPIQSDTRFQNREWPPPATGTSLGKRKRDEASLSPPPPPKKGKKQTATGVMLDEWKPRTDRNSMPWCKYDHSVTENVGFWLHKEICDFYEYVRPTFYETLVRDDLMHRLEKAIRLRHPSATLHSFGSYAAGLYLPNADMDLVVLSEEFSKYGEQTYGLSHNWYYKLGRFLESQGICQPGSLEVIVHAKVPIIKFLDDVTGIRVDLSAENATGPTAVRTFEAWRNTYQAMPIIVTLVKQFLAMRGLNEVSNGGLGGFSVTCLVTSLLQHIPQVQSGNMIAEHHLGEILLEFFDLYGNRFDIVRSGLQLNPPGYFSKFNHPRLDFRRNPDRLAIEDPNNPANDISGGSHNIDVILRCFSQAYDDLQSKICHLHQANFQERSGQSILGVILAGNYSTFDWHRRRLREVSEHHLGWKPN